ncbi:hypothetical protein D0T50_12305 [Bacteroides sp. 214]|uniref:hypothetical protein n=1 Tax=Bacteroides sp. 214 TaxID=2302935 RepID=UPI0013D8C39D|nr:hypothetical protein [Bacteroides sp. 214]NDW13666.1 hypothetical protein [Bacteroides sp. 214]
MKRIMLFILLISTLTSCYPPRIIYSIKDTQPSCLRDSVDVRLIKGSTITTGGLSLFPNLYLEISNNKENSIFINQNSTLELRTDSAILKYEISSDSLVYQLGKNDKQLLHLSFRATDFERITYKTVDIEHKLYLLLDLYNDNGEKIEKCVILKPTGTKRMKYEEPPF